MSTFTYYHNLVLILEKKQKSRKKKQFLSWQQSYNLINLFNLTHFICAFLLQVMDWIHQLAHLMNGCVLALMCVSMPAYFVTGGLIAQINQMKEHIASNVGIKVCCHVGLVYVNFIPLWEWVWCYHRQDWNTGAIVRLHKKCVRLQKRRCWNPHALVETCYDTILSQSGKKFSLA